MRINKCIIWVSAVLMLFSSVVSQAARKGELTLLMIPREEETLRVGTDIANRYETLLVSYKLGANNAVSLNGWTGSQWVSITLENFQKGNFFRKGPDSALVVTKAGSPVPRKMIPPADWCTSASMITTTELRPLLHLTGRYFNFSYKDWNWFAKRYNMEMDAINPDQLNVAWYHRRMSENLTPRAELGASDLQYWASIRRPETLIEPAGPEPSEEAEEAVSAEDMDNPLTNEVPTAVIMGAGDADEELSTEPAAAGDEAEETVAEDQAAGTQPEEAAPDATEAAAAEEEVRVEATEAEETAEVSAEVEEESAKVSGEMQ